MTNGCNSQTKNKPTNYKDTSNAVYNYFLMLFITIFKMLKKMKTSLLFLMIMKNK